MRVAAAAHLDGKLHYTISMRMGSLGTAAAVLIAVGVGAAPPEVMAQEGDSDGRRRTISRARVWHPTNVSAMDIRRGSDRPGAFRPDETVQCDYVKKSLPGASPKFACRLPDGDEVKVKFGGTNGEVYGEVAASRLLWALGFGADDMYPVRVICRGCPAHFAGIRRQNGDQIFDPAVIERKLSSREVSDRWEWEELEQTNPEIGGATRAQRDALKLLAVLLQHSDSKAVNHRIVCADPSEDSKAGAGECTQPLTMIHDVGNTFGRANAFNQQPRASVNLAEWARLPVWKPGTACIGNLVGAWDGTLKEPKISEEGRLFLSELLSQLSDQQLYDLFDVARVYLRPRVPTSGRSGFATVNEWVSAFKDKRNQIMEKRCPE